MAFLRKRALLVSALLLFLIVGLFFYPWYREGSLNPCETLSKMLISTLLEPYSGTGREPNLLEPAALAIGRKRVKHFVGQKAEIERAMVLYLLWRDPEEIRKQLKGLRK